MKFHISTDYAIRIVLHLAQCAPQVASAPMASEQLGITYPYFTKIASALKQASLIESVKGSGGGYRLARPASDISLYDIVCVMQGEIHLNHCLEENGVCSLHGCGSTQCSVHQVLKEIQGDMIDKLKEQSIEELCKTNNRTQKSLPFTDEENRQGSF